MLKKILMISTMLLIESILAQQDPFLQYQWNLNKILAPSAWNISSGSSTIIIAILDNGVDSQHPDLKNKLVLGFDVIDNDNTTDPLGNYYHGTACAGVAAAETYNSIGMAGVGYNCKIMPIQLAHDDNINNPQNFISGLNWAVNNGADIICFSGHTDENQDVINAIDYATTYGRSGKGCVIVKSAGNSGDGGITFPGKYSKVISVGATDSNDNRVLVSSFGPELDVVAPSNVFATDIYGPRGIALGDYFGYFPNTSSAAPHVAGLAGLILAFDNTLSEENVRKIICYSADDINTLGFDNETGWGRINAWRALDAILNRTTSGSLQRDEIWYGTINLIDNVIIPNGVKLTILSGTTLNMGTNSIISSGGTINIESNCNGIAAKVKNLYSTTYKGIYGTVQTAINSAGYADEVYIEDGTFTENINISNKNNIYIYGGIINGSISVNNTPGLNILGTECTSLYLNNCTFPMLNNLTISGYGSGNGLSLYGTGYNPGNLFNMTIYNFATGFYANSSWCYSDSEFSFFMDLTNGVKADNNAYVYLEGNQLCGISGYHLWAINGSDIYATNCYYDNGTPAIFEYNDGDVIVNGSGSCSLRKTSDVKNLDKPEKTDNNVTTTEFDLIINQLIDLSNSVNKDILEKKIFDKIKFKNEFKNITEKLGTFIKYNSDSKFGGQALTTAVLCFKMIGDYELMKSFLKNIPKESSLNNLAKRFMMDYYCLQNDHFNALLLADELIKETQSDTSLVINILYAKGLILSHDLKNYSSAAECFAKIIKKYPNNQMVEMAKNQLMILGNEVEKDVIEKAKVLNDSDLRIANYPNPFNPTTTISYSLPEAGNVQVKIFDVLGREIAKLVDETKSAGKHSVEWNGSNYASGIYFYTITFNNQTLYKKMLMIK